MLKRGKAFSYSDATVKRDWGSRCPSFIVQCQQLLGYHWQPIKCCYTLDCCPKAGEKAFLSLGNWLVKKERFDPKGKLKVVCMGKMGFFWVFRKIGYSE